MKNKNFTPTVNTVISKAYVVLLFLFTFGFVQNSFAQTQDCPLSCNDLVQVSLNNTCDAVITPEMVIEGENDNVQCNYKIYKVLNKNNVLVGTANLNGSWTLDGDLLLNGQTYTVEVGFNPAINNVCWGKILVEDKIAPTIRCLDTVYVPCSEDLSDYLTTDTDYKYSYVGPQPIVPSVGPNYSGFPFLIPDGGTVSIPFMVDNKANQSEIFEFVQAVLSLSTTTGVTVKIQSPTENSPSVLSNPFSDSYFYGKQVTNPYVDGLWHIVIYDNLTNGSQVTVNSAQLRLKSKGFLRIGGGVIVNDNCHLSEASVKVLSDLTEVNPQQCGSYFWQRVIKYQGKDWVGMPTGVCTHVIRWEHNSFEDMEWPHNWDGIDTLPLSCTGYFMQRLPNGKLTDSGTKWDKNGDGYPQPEEVDVPTIDGNPIWPEMGNCMMNVLYKDEVHEICPGSFKVLRKWIAYDMCLAGSSDCCNGDENPREHYQLIKVLDLTPITFETYTTSTYTVSTKPFKCSADVTLPVPIIQNYGCTNGYTYEVGYCSTQDGVFEYFQNITSKYVNNNKVYTILDLPLGETCVRYRVTDECGNVSEGTLTVIVKDDVPPIPVCDEHTVATVATECTARVYAETFDDGSFDNCSDVTFKVAKMNGTAIGTFGDYVDYGSGDVGKTLQVVLKVTDESNNSNTCMVQIYIDDKIGPTITCPQTATIDCNVDPHNVSLTGGQPTFWDNCNATVTYTESGSLNQCNVGTFTRTWTATDNGGRKAICFQTINVVNTHPFVMLGSYWPADKLNLVGCTNTDTDPSKTGQPNLSADDYCSMVAATYKDRVFNVVNGACFKILRDWTVIDWCQYNDHNPVYLGLPGNPYVGMWTHTQVIMVSDNNLPQFTSDCTNKSICAYNANCTGDVTLTATATDECTPTNELVWTYEVTGGNLTAPIKGYTSTFTKTNMALGTYQIRWTVEDKCGNLQFCSYSFTVKDCKNPTPLCYSEITTVVMPSTTPRMVTIKARDFDRGSTDNCNPGATCGQCYTQLRFSFSGTDPKDSLRTFTQDQVGLQELDMWVWDVAGNRDYCTVTVHIQDNVNSGHLVAGLIKTEIDQKVSEVKVTSQDMISNESMTVSTSDNGMYQFNVDPERSYNFRAEKTGDFMNGLSTLDIVMIQKHILGIKNINNPYKLIAADANNDKKVTSSDILALRNMILGNTQALPNNNNSWKFIDSKYNFINPENPWFSNNDEMYNLIVNNPDQNTIDNNFVAIKVGDVNNSVQIGGAALDGRNTMAMEFVNKSFRAGNVIEVPVYLTSMESMEGMQFSLNFNSELIDLQDIESNILDISGTNYAEHNNSIFFSWNSQNSVKLNSENPIMILKFIAKEDGQLNKQLALNNDINAEVYNEDLNIFNLTLNQRDADNSEFTLYQNMPNPFTNETEIAFSLPENGEVKLTIYDVTGKVMYQKIQNYNRGYNSVSVSKDDLNFANGVLYYKVENGANIAVRKMVMLAK